MRTEYGERSGKIVTARLPFFRLEVSVVLALARDGRPAFELDAENGRCVTESESGMAGRKCIAHSGSHRLDEQTCSFARILIRRKL
jgi:hypothetical protein